jgi:hypothetical protein
VRSWWVPSLVAFYAWSLAAFGCYQVRQPFDGDGPSGSRKVPTARPAGGSEDGPPAAVGVERGPAAVGGKDAASGGARPDAARAAQDRAHDPAPPERAPEPPVDPDDPASARMHGAPDAGPFDGPRRLTPTVPGLRVAFLGDQSMGTEARAVLALVARERADAVVHLGDFAYDHASPAHWEAQIDAILGRDFPYFAAVGNHDVPSWSGTAGFAAVLAARVARMPEARCRGELGVNSICYFRGLALLLSGVGSYGRGHEAFLDSALAETRAAFRLCLWHKNQHDMQVGGKLDEVGWEAYRICARHGALIVSAHEHSYARTRTLEAISDRSRSHGPTGEPALLDLAPGRTAVIVSGLGGHSTRARTDDHIKDSWWASVYAQDYQLENGVETTAPEIEFGALFIDFGVAGDPFKARGYFKTTDGEIHDRFVLQVARRKAERN